MTSKTASLMERLAIIDAIQETARETGVRIDPHQVKYLVLVAEHPGITTPELLKHTHAAALGVVSRNMSVLSELGAPRTTGHRPGLGFVKVCYVRHENKNAYYLTDAGEQSPVYALWTQTIMDHGALCCTSKQPA